MAKPVIMNFADGPSEIKIGQRVVYDNGQSGKYHFTLHEDVVEKVGRLLVTLKNGDQFYLEDGRRKAQYTTIRLYSSKEVYEKITQEGRFIQKVEASLVTSLVRRSLTLAQAEAIVKVLDLKLEEE